MSEKKGRRIWSKRATWVLLHAVHFFQTYREVGELEIALSFALLQMSLGHWSWKYLTGDLPRPAQPFREGPSRKVTFFWTRFFRISFFVEESRCGESRASALSLSLLHDDTAIRCEEQLIKH